MGKPKPKSSTRRKFLLGALGATGALIVGWGVMPIAQRLDTENTFPPKEGEITLNGWVKIARDGTVIVAMSRNEMGQGVHTALPMLLAEELDVPLSMVSIEQAPMDKIYGDITILPGALPFHPDSSTGVFMRGAKWLSAKAARSFGIMITGNSTSIRDCWEPMREAGAAARAMLVAAAAKEWNVPAGECRTEDGAVLHGSGKRAGYGELAEKAAGTRPGKIKLKEPKDFKLIGHSQPRRDAPSKVNGRAGYGIDVRREGMVYAAVRMAPVFGAGVQQVDEAAVSGMPGVLKVVRFSRSAGSQAGVAVIARSFWQAKQAAAALPVTWDKGPNAGLSSDGIFKQLAAALDNDSGFTYYKTGDMDAGRNAAKTVRAEYRAPFLAHATMEPINCTVQVKDGEVDVWLPTQVPGLSASAAAKAAGVPLGKVRVHETYLGGGFGRRLETDMVTQATTIAAQAGGVPVQVIWTREEDMGHDFYRPAAIARFSASLDGQGGVLAYDNKSAGGSVSHHMMDRAFGLPKLGPDKYAAEGEFDLCYEFPNQHIAHVIVDSEVPLGSWRSVGHSQNAFFKESFIDEMAHAGGRDPVEFRRNLLQRHPRHLAVLNAAVEKAGAPAQGRAHGVALHDSFGAIVAQVAEVSVEGADIRVHRVVCAIDCGIAVNPDGVAQQMESGILFGLSAALFGEITIKDGKVEQQNFHNYPVVRMNQAPVVETVIMKSAEPPGGVGEPGTPPVAPAVANAVFQLTGKRLRSLPLKLA
ncbi:xanthine dehydrogenase family protein molybdopterin-binding subunit [Noviherbaspirillum galbum]|uniref:Xanthine dehydrogenase family protein molybdopterin-binding subunit n=1 Tax=Noviherbaspirillum galbum TaxID=2709383 RepID=A0A6B3SQB1_9BURK|nr:xanthine dehydrogenase family protein molybdopterin-binding subunit [Noviherbaspirillum galbum]NEX62831.1 xanthine dehydrogenase family protein molybdopterin-binding subunit [Noviherbaspirillum galbum]